jgi:hypothetical protein
MKPRHSIKTFAIFFICLACCHLAVAAELQQKTNEAFNRYAAATEARFADDFRPGGPFLYVDSLGPDRKLQAYSDLSHGSLWIEKLENTLPGMSADIPGGMLHHWVGIVFIKGATLEKTLRIVKDYDRRSEYYKPDVIASRLVSHQGDDYKIFLRLRQKKFTTAIFNTNYDIHWGSVDATHVYSNSVSTRIAEVKNSDKPDGEELPVGTGNGYVWRLNTYWRFAEKDGGVYIQCEALSLSRDIPAGLGWALNPLVSGIPRESLVRVLGRTSEIVQEEMKRK